MTGKVKQGNLRILRLLQKLRLRFYNPIPRAIQLSRRTVALIRGTGKEPVVIEKEVKGFIGNRLQFALGGRFASWTDRNLEALEACRDLLTPVSIALFERFREARQGGPITRLIKLRQSGVHRQTAFGQVSLYVAGMLGKL